MYTMHLKKMATFVNQNQQNRGIETLRGVCGLV